MLNIVARASLTNLTLRFSTPEKKNGMCRKSDGSQISSFKYDSLTSFNRVPKHVQHVEFNSVKRCWVEMLLYTYVPPGSVFEGLSP